MNLTPTQLAHSWRAAANRAANPEYAARIACFAEDVDQGHATPTEDGFTLTAERGVPGGPFYPEARVDYRVDERAQTVEVTQLDYPRLGPSYQSSLGGQEHYRLDVARQAVTEHTHGPAPQGSGWVVYGGGRVG